MILGGEDVVGHPSDFKVDIISQGGLSQENADHLLEAGVGKKMEEYQAKSARQKYGKSAEYQDFREKIWVSYLAGLFASSLIAT